MTDRIKKGEQTKPALHDVVAVVGLGLSLPGAASVDEFWSNILNGRRFFQPATALDWGAEPDKFVQAGAAAPDKAYSRNGAFNHNRKAQLEGLDLPKDFDPKSADDSLIFWLQAGLQARSQVKWQNVDPAKVGVIAGHVILPTTAMAEAAASLYSREASRGWDNPPSFDPAPPLAFKLLGYSARLLCKALGFSGPAYTIDAACASSLYAVHLAVEDLLSGKLDVAISGGVAKADALFTQLGFSQLRALSVSGSINAFDEKADGLVVGEGAVALVLKRLDKALADGDNIRAVIRGIGLSNDQTGNILAPQAEGQLRAMLTAWNKANIDPAEVDLIEAHGTGTILGDRVEVETLKELLSHGKKRKRAKAPVLGSVKSSIGHLLSAAGAASMAKVVLALENKILPPTAGFTTEAPGLNLSDEPALRVLSEPEKWDEPAESKARVAVVNAFGFGGVNAQIIVEEWRPELWKKNTAKASPRPFKKVPDPVRLLSARTLSAPWPDFSSLAQNWMDSEGPPIIVTRRFGYLKATGLFFNSLILEGANLRLAPKDLAHLLPQQALALKMADETMADANLISSPGTSHIRGIGSPENASGVDKTRVGVFMGVDVDPRSADYAFRWLGPLRTAEMLAASGNLPLQHFDDFVEELRKKSHPALTASRVIGALGSLVASRVARFLGTGGPAFTVAQENISGLRALKLAMEAINRGEIDMAMVGMVDTMGDPKTAALEPKRLWEEGAAMLIVSSEEAATALGRPHAPQIEELLDFNGRIGGLGGLFPLVKNAFYIRHRLASRGLGAGTAYWIKNKQDPPRRLECPGFAITEMGGEEVSSPPYSYDDATWFLIRSQNKQDSLALLNRLEEMATHHGKNHSLEGLGPIRSEKRALKRLGDRFWAEYGNASGAKPALAILARNFEDLLNLIKKAKEKLQGQNVELLHDQKSRIIWALEGERLRGEMAWVFPGSGSHYPGLGRKLAMRFPNIMGQLEKGVTRLADHFQSALFWGPNYREVSTIQGILGQVSFGLLGSLVLKRFKLNPQAIIGYSLGEVTGLLAGGAWTDRENIYNDLLSSPLFTHELGGDLSLIRKQLKWPSGKYFKWVMGVVPRSADAVKKALESLNPQLRERAFLMLTNTRHESVVGGEEAAVRALSSALGTVLCPIEGAAAVHTPLVKAVAEEYRKFHTRPTNPPEGLRFYSAAWGRSYGLSPEKVADSLTDQAIYGLDFPKLIEQAYADGVRYFIEVGPGATVSRMINDILRDRPHLASSLSPSANEEGWMGVNRLLVELWMAGWPLKMSILYPDSKFSGTIKLPVPIALSPETGIWPEPEEVLKELTLRRQKTQGNKEADHKTASRESMEKNPQPKITTTFGQPNERDQVFRQWLAHSKKEKEQQIEAMKSDSPAPLSRAQCLEFATGKIAGVLGERFHEVDTYPSRVRLPDEPLMFVDRVISMEGKALSMSSGRIVTEHDILPGAWYLDQNHIPTGLTIESGQADLMLSAWLGADFATKGLALYRLLDAEVTFHRPFLPRVGETVRYDIRIVRFFKYGQTHLFRFEFDASINGEPLLSMKNGCAGFFTPTELAGGRGLPGGGLTDETTPSFIDPGAVSSLKLPGSMSKTQLDALRQGDIEKAFNRPAPIGLKKPLSIPGGRLALIDRVVKMEKNGGRYSCGFIRAEMDVDPKAWFLTSHFVGDEVMPGTLMYESCLYTMRTFLLACGWIGEADEVDWQPVPGVAASLKCRGQVTGATKTAAYEIHIRRLEFKSPYEGAMPEPCAIADAIMLADNRPIVEVRNMHLRLAGFSRAKLKAALNPEKAVSRGEIKTSKDHFDKKKLLALASGRPSEALGAAYARFDNGDFVARLPRPPYDLIDEATIISGQSCKMTAGSQVKAVFTPKSDSWLFKQAGGVNPHLPYAALNEVALQPCGFLAAYMGSALPFAGPMHFRNLGGEATVISEALPDVPIYTIAKLTKASRMGEMLIQHFEFNCKSQGRLVYEGVTHFGFFNPQSLSHQAGLASDGDAWLNAGKKIFQPYPVGSPWPGELLRMIDEISLDANGGSKALGFAVGKTAVKADAWFFDAHFYQDPVWPGSLGLEAFLQTAKALVYQKFGRHFSEESIRWQSPLPHKPHQWLYRGQITRDKKEMTVVLDVVDQNELNGSITADGVLLIDNLPIYKMTGFCVRISGQPHRRKIKQAPQEKQPVAARKRDDAPNFSAEDILNWRTEHGISQGQLAKLMGVTPIYISLMERGKRNISPLMAEKLELIFSGNFSSPDGASDQDSQILSKGTMKSRREEKEAAAKLLSPEQMRQLRSAKGMSQKKLADQVGVTATLIGLIELGKRGLSLELAQKILAVLKG